MEVVLRHVSMGRFVKVGGVVITWLVIYLDWTVHTSNFVFTPTAPLPLLNLTGSYGSNCVAPIDKM